MLTIAVVIIAAIMIAANLDIVLGFAVLAGAMALFLAVIFGGLALYIHAPEVFVFLVIAGIFYAAYYLDMYSKRVK